MNESFKLVQTFFGGAAEGVGVLLEVTSQDSPLVEVAEAVELLRIPVADFSEDVDGFLARDLPLQVSQCSVMDRLPG